MNLLISLHYPLKSYSVSMIRANISANISAKTFRIVSVPLQLPFSQIHGVLSHHTEMIGKEDSSAFVSFL